MTRSVEPWVTLTLERPVPRHLADELKRRIYFVSEAIEAFEIDLDEGPVERLRFRARGSPAEREEVGRKIGKVVEREVLGLRAPAPRVVWTGAAADAAVDRFPEMRAQGIAFEAGEGQFALGEPVISLMDRLDEALRAVAFAGAGPAEEYRYPTLIRAEVLERSGYFRAFPHFVMFVTRLHNDIDAYDRFLADYAAASQLPDSLFSHCVNHDYCLPPTMCYHVFHQLSDRSVPAPRVVTARGKSFRFESRYHEGLARLWDFTIREIVMIGSSEWVVDARARLMADVFALMDALRLSGRCEVANDHFFADADTLARVAAQQIMESKLELRLDVAPGRSVAVGSFNLHERHFTDAFAIEGAEHDRLFSACAGFGLERLAYAFVCQHGLDPRGWPAFPAAN